MSKTRRQDRTRIMRYISAAIFASIISFSHAAEAQTCSYENVVAVQFLYDAAVLHGHSYRPYCMRWQTTARGFAWKSREYAVRSSACNTDQLGWRLVQRAKDGFWKVQAHKTKGRIGAFGTEPDVCLERARYTTDVLLTPCDDSNDRQAWSFKSTNEQFQKQLIYELRTKTESCVKTENATEKKFSYSRCSGVGANTRGLHVLLKSKSSGATNGGRRLADAVDDDGDHCPDDYDSARNNSNVHNYPFRYCTAEASAACSGRCVVSGGAPYCHRPGPNDVDYTQATCPVRWFQHSGGCFEALPQRPKGFWHGYYSCAGNDSGGEVQNTTVNGSGSVAGIFSFRYFDGAANTWRQGSYYVSGSYSNSTRRLALSPGAWIERPPVTVPIGLSGTVSQDGSRYDGSFSGAVCQPFSLSLGTSAGVAFPSGGRWACGYRCAGNDSEGTLAVSERNGAVSGTFGFRYFSQRDGIWKRGSYNVAGTYRPKFGTLELTPGAWITRPPGTMSIGMAGAIKGGWYVGRFPGTTCDAFSWRSATPN